MRQVAAREQLVQTLKPVLMDDANPCPLVSSTEEEHQTEVRNSMTSTTTDSDTAASNSTSPWRSPTIQIVLATTLLAPLGVPLISPTLPAFRDAFGITDAQASLLISTYFLVGIVLSPFIGMLADRIGRRTVLIASLVVFSLSGGAIAFVPSYEVVLALRLIGGTAAAGIFITTVTLIGDSFEGTQRNRVLGMNNAVLSAGAALFPIVGGALATVSWNVPYFVYLAGLPLSLYAVRHLEEPKHVRDSQGIAYLRRAVRVLSGTDALVLYGAACMTELLLFGAVVTILPFLLAGDFGMSALSIGIVLAFSEVASVVVSAKNGWFARYLSNYGLIAVGFACYAIGLFGAWLAPTPATITLAMVVFGVGLGLSMPAVDAAISDLVSAGLRGGALSLRNSTTFLGRAAGPVLFASIAATTGYYPLFVASAVVASAVALFVLSMGLFGTHRVTHTEEADVNVR
ncbi:MFS transporter [Haladaptatus sp. DFWS20]|uniref:MFS transporter n=1 Tax=Haladaptatus sp. DFWS20 TaxID=3403467 RepID=UPI003EC08FAD